MHVFVPYEDFIEKRVKVWLDGYQTNYSRDGYFSDPLCENFEYWNFNFQPGRKISINMKKRVDNYCLTCYNNNIN